MNEILLSGYARARWKNCACRGGFSLIELLVVIGIIAILMGILMPVVSRAKASANRTACQSNLRQIGLAMQTYAYQNDGWYPHSASRSTYGHHSEDWIYWQTGLDFSSGQIARLLKSPGGTAALFRCPNDNWSVHPSNAPLNYQYSYTMNYEIASDEDTSLPATRRLTSIRTPAAKILMVEENTTTIDDGRWVWGGDTNDLSTLHDYSYTDQRARGNCLFCDGHVDFVSRANSFTPLYSDPSVRAY